MFCYSPVEFLRSKSKISDFVFHWGYSRIAAFSKNKNKKPDWLGRAFVSRVLLFESASNFLEEDHYPSENKCSNG